ncbi:MAG: hypothetical protein U0736_00760 [Gemmataceae bacterium]
MTHPPRRLLAAILLLAVAPLAAADTPPEVERVRVGLPAGPDAGCTRNGAWAPVAVTLRGGKEGNPQGAYRLRIETTDLEEIAYQIVVPVPALAADGLRTVQGYVVPGSDGAGFRVHLETASGRPVRSMPPLSREIGRELVVGHQDVLYLAAGAALNGLKRAADRLDRPDDKGDVAFDGPRRQLIHTDDPAMLPDRWLGYDAVDVVVLPTGNREFVLRLASDAEAPRRQALLEWVRRGGVLILSVGRNRQETAALLAKLPLLDCQITGSETVRSFPVLSTQWANRVGKPPLAAAEVATLVPGRDVDVLVREERRPIVVQAACGLGRVIGVAFDLDAPPFSTWEGQDDFWARLQSEVAPHLSTRGRRKAGEAKADPGAGGGQTDKIDLQAELKRTLETFEDVPAVSFGWVALFILFYIVLVGPLDYFVLKKLFKRLELTWITFPVSVLVVSVVAYVVAYQLKGTDLRVNKVDLVEVDLTGGPARQVYGSAWFTLFSPRVASYTIGVEPADSWAGKPAAGAPGPVVTMLEAGERVLRAGSQGLFRRPYEYADDAAGLRRVPIPVWATRSFTAAWRAPLPAEKPPIGIHDDVGPVRLARDGNVLVGRITNQLPVRLQDVTLFFRGRWYNLDRLEPGEWKRLEPLFAGEARGQHREIAAWFSEPTLAPGLPLASTGRPVNAAFLPGRETFQLVKQLLFFRAAERAGVTNAGLRRLDQSWRLRELPQYPPPDRPLYREEAILVARADAGRRVRRRLVRPGVGYLTAARPAARRRRLAGDRRLSDPGNLPPRLPAGAG